MKKLFAILITVLIFLFPAATAYAARDTVVEFCGFDEGFVFDTPQGTSSTDLFSGFKNVMPGDVLCQTVHVRNLDKEYEELRFSLSAHLPNGAPYALTDALFMRVSSNGSVLYEGTPAASFLGTQPVFLGALRKGEEMALDVELHVPLSLDNRFADTFGQIDWVFLAEAVSEHQRTVRVIWQDGNENHPDEVLTAFLTCDGVPHADFNAQISAENQWMHTFDGLESGRLWESALSGLPEGYHAEKQVSGSTDTFILIPNLPDGGGADDSDISGTKPAPMDLTVSVSWDDDHAPGRPGYVVVTLYDGTSAAESVRLDAACGWTHTWHGLPSDRNWQVIEIAPAGYYPTYHAENHHIHIVNHRSLIKTGQQRYPTVLLLILGAALIALGLYLRRKKGAGTT